MACCCDPPPRCPTCEGKTCEIDGVSYYNRFQAYYSKFEGQIEEVEGCPGWAGYAGSSRSQQLWRCCPITPPSFFVPAANVPEFTWNEGYPEKLSGCLAYFTLDRAIAAQYGEGCCSFNSLDGLRCEVRERICAFKGKFRWRLFLIDCEQESLVDITGEALTPVGVFEGTFDLLTDPDRDCESVASTAQPDYFDDPTVVCNN